MMGIPGASKTRIKYAQVCLETDVFRALFAEILIEHVLTQPDCTHIVSAHTGKGSGEDKETWRGHRCLHLGCRAYRVRFELPCRLVCPCHSAEHHIYLHFAGYHIKKVWERTQKKRKVRNDMFP